MSNKIFQSLLYTDSQLSVIVKLHSVWEKLRDDEMKLGSWFDRIESINNSVKVEMLSFLYGVLMGKNKESTVLKVLKMIVDMVDFAKDISVELLPMLVYKIANDKSPDVRLECLKALPLMAKAKVSAIALFIKLKLYFI